MCIRDISKWCYPLAHEIEAGKLKRSICYPDTPIANKPTTPHATHTPGPWCWIDPHVLANVMPEVERSVLSCETDGPDEWDDTYAEIVIPNPYDRQLIVSAPGLLEELRASNQFMQELAAKLDHAARLHPDENLSRACESMSRECASAARTFIEPAIRAATTLPEDQ